MMDSAIWAADRRSADAENPWPGLLSFSEADKAFFRGRNREAEALGRLVLRGRLTVLFGLSGLGKSSLLQAGLFPRLRRENVLPVYVRLDFSDSQSDLVSQITDAIAKQAAAAGVEAPPVVAGETLWEYFHRRGADFWSPRNRPMLPLLVFDQFEEIFTLGRGHPDRAGLMATLADLAEGRPPAELKARFDERPEEAEKFAFGRHHYKLLLSLREDYLPDLEVLREQIAAVALNRLRLRRMDGVAALAVVRQGGELVADEVAESIVRFVAKAPTPDVPLNALQVEPALLSVVCRELNNKRLERGDAKITASLLEGSAEEILSGFYERAVVAIPPAVRTFVEEELLVEGHRDSVALEKALSVPGIDRQAIDQLVDRRLVRIDPRDGVERLELTHDLLTDVIAASRDRRRRREAARRDLVAREEAEEREQKARRKLRRSRLYSAVLVATVILSLVAMFYANRQRQRLADSRAALVKSREAALSSQQEFQDEADEAAATIAELKDALEKQQAALEKQGEIGEKLRTLLEGQAQESKEVEERLKAAEQSRQDLNIQADQALSIATKRLSDYSVVRKQAVLADVTLVAIGDRKIEVIKVVRAATSLGLKESKELVDSAPVRILEAISMKEAEAVRSRLREAGAQVKVEPVQSRK